MVNEKVRRLTIRRAKEEGNYTSLCKFLRYDDEYRRKSSLISIYQILKESNGTELIFYNGGWVRAADIFKKLNLKFNKEEKYIKEKI